VPPFGSSLALAGDTLAVGAVNEDSGATGVNGNQEEAPKIASGAVYVFRRQDDGTWTQEAYIKASNTSSMASFGSSVALYTAPACRRHHRPGCHSRPWRTGARQARRIGEPLDSRFISLR
jgi:hypothetical protein